MPNLLLVYISRNFYFDLLQAPCHQLHFPFVPNQCCGQHFLMSNCYNLHLLHHSSECAIYNGKFCCRAFKVSLGAITVGVHKRNVSPQNHFQDITLNDNYIYEFFFLIDIFSLNTRFFIIKLMVIFTIWMIKTCP